MFDKNKYSTLAIYGEKPLSDGEKAILDDQCNRWPIVRCQQGATPELAAENSNLLWSFRLNTIAPPVSDAKALSAQIPGCTFALDFGTSASCWRACLKYSAGKVIGWSAAVNQRCTPTTDEGADKEIARQAAGGEAEQAIEVLREIAAEFYRSACGFIYMGIVDGVGLSMKERMFTNDWFEAYDAIKEILPDEAVKYLCDLEEKTRAWLDTAEEGKYPEDEKAEHHQAEDTGEENKQSTDESTGQDSNHDDAAWRQDRMKWESLPRTVSEHPWIRSARSLGFVEEVHGAVRKTAALNRAEIEMVANHHFGQLRNFCSFVMSGAAYDRWELMRARHHWERASELIDLLPEKDQKKFSEEMDEIRKEYLDIAHEFEEVNQ